MRILGARLPMKPFQHLMCDIEDLMPRRTFHRMRRRGIGDPHSATPLLIYVLVWGQR